MKKYFIEHKFEVIYVCVITLFALLLRLIALINFGDFWTDELYSLYFSIKTDDLAIVKSLFNEDFHVPLYFILLNKWCFLFGDNPFVLRLMGCLITTLTVPLSYIVTKKYFGNLAFYVAFFVAISAFNIHYSCELRFYGMAIFLGLLTTYFFIEFIQKFDKKSIIAYVISALLLLYTYNFAFMYIFCQFVVGAFYQRKNILKYFCIYSIIGLVYAPVIVMILHNVITYNTSILKFTRDIFAFDISYFGTFLITVYSNLFEQFMTNDVVRSYQYIEKFFVFKYFMLVWIPVGLGIVGLYNALKSKNEQVRLFIYPAILLFVIQVLMAFTQILALNLRYTIITTTVLLIASIGGYAFIKNKVVSICLINIWLLLNMFFYTNFTINTAMNRNIIYTSNLQNLLSKVKIKNDFPNSENNDIIFIPRFSKLLMRYVDSPMCIDFDSYDALLLGNRPQDLDFIFGKSVAKNLNRKNSKKILYPYLVNDEPLAIQDNLNIKYFSKMKKGQKFIIITDDSFFLRILNFIQDKFKGNNVYEKSAIYDSLSAKIVKDSITSADKNLKSIQTLKDDNLFSIYVYQK